LPINFERFLLLKYNLNLTSTYINIYIYIYRKEFEKDNYDNHLILFELNGVEEDK
jgi:hypothetical protein